MADKFDSRHPLIGLIDEVIRLNGRLRPVFAEVRRTLGLGESELMVLNAVVEADRPPTVSQIGRSLGYPRQIIQRAANMLVHSDYIATAANPDHKRAPLLIATDKGRATKQRADAMAHDIAEQWGGPLDADILRAATQAAAAARMAIEQNGRVSR